MLIGETLNEEQVDTLFAECMGEENDDGEVDYIRECFGMIENRCLLHGEFPLFSAFLAKMCGKE